MRQRIIKIKNTIILNGSINAKLIIGIQFCSDKPSFLLGMLGFIIWAFRNGDIVNRMSGI